MNNLKVGKKFLVVFGSIIVCTIAVLLVLINGMTNTANRYTYFYTKNYTVVASIGDMRARLQACVKSTLLASIVPSDQVEQQISNAENYYNLYKERKEWVMNNYEGDLSLMREVDSLVQSMEDEKQRINELCRTKTGNTINEEAEQLLVQQYVPTMESAALKLVDFSTVVNEVVDNNYNNTIKTEKIFLIISIIVSILAVLMAIILALLLTKNIVLPIKEVQVAMEKIASGDLNTTLTHKSKDELGMLQDSVRYMSDFLNSVIGDVDQFLAALGKGNFQTDTVVGEERYVGVYNSLLQSTRSLRDTMNVTLSQINESSDQVAMGANQVSAGAQALSQGATEQASSVEELAATISEISSAINNNAASAQDASNKSGIVKNHAAEGSKQMEEMLNAMNEISDSSKEIGKIVKTIEDIAFQTNILALNAAVEAARAGEAGKGFAVVAEEVRSLAAKSAAASGETAELIEESIERVNAGSKIADETAKAMEEISRVVQESEAIINGIAESSNYQATAVAQIEQAITQVSQVVQTNSATSEECAAASEELSNQAARMKEMLAIYNLGNGSASGSYSGGSYSSSSSSSNEQVISLGDDFGKY